MDICGRHGLHACMHACSRFDVLSQSLAFRLVVPEPCLPDRHSSPSHPPLWWPFRRESLCSQLTSCLLSALQKARGWEVDTRADGAPNGTTASCQRTPRGGCAAETHLVTFRVVAVGGSVVRGRGNHSCPADDSTNASRLALAATFFFSDACVQTGVVRATAAMAHAAGGGHLGHEVVDQVVDATWFRNGGGPGTQPPQVNRSPLQSTDSPAQAAAPDDEPIL